LRGKVNFVAAETLPIDGNLVGDTRAQD